MSRNFLARMVQRNLEWANGRIRPVQALWRFVGTKYGRPLGNGHVLTGKCHSTGRDMELVLCRAVGCPNPEMDGQYPKTEAHYSVPASVCRKCVHRSRPREDGLRYPFCKYAKAERGGPEGAARSLLAVMAQATRDAQRIMGGLPPERDGVTP